MQKSITSSMSSLSLKDYLPRLLILGIVDVFAIQLMVALGQRISFFLGLGIAIFTIVANIVFLNDRLYPWRWITPALAGMALLVIYPIGFTIVIALTNYGEGHVLTKDQVVKEYFAAEYYEPASAVTYRAYIFRSDPLNAFKLWLVAPDGKTYIATPGESGLKEIAPGDSSVGERDEKGVPKALGEFQRLPAGGALRFGQSLQAISITDGADQVKITRISGLSETQEMKRQQQRWAYDPQADTLTNRETSEVYRVERGNFVTGEGEGRKVLTPGFQAFIGVDNIVRVITDENVRDPFWRVFFWTIAFAAGTVGTTFALGLLFALVLNSHDLPLKPLWRSILIIPYAVPFWLSTVTWRGLLNPEYGPISQAIKGLTGNAPNWFADPTLIKIAILLVNLYLGFPYMMLITLGALQSIPADMYEAAVIDGANDVQQFRFITLPMLLLAVGPLLVASFAFNFNNFTLIELFYNGGPPISASTAAGHSDILLSYTFRLAFSGSRGAEYGFAAAIGIFIFLIVGTITFFNFRFTRQLEEISANV